MGKNKGWSWWVFDPGMRNGNKKVGAHQRNTQKKMGGRKDNGKKEGEEERLTWQDVCLKSCILNLDTVCSIMRLCEPPLWCHLVEVNMRCWDPTSLNICMCKEFCEGLKDGGVGGEDDSKGLKEHLPHSFRHAAHECWACLHQSAQTQKYSSVLYNFIFSIILYFLIFYLCILVF